jgi:hypothetical protein
MEPVVVERAQAIIRDLTESGRDGSAIGRAIEWRRVWAELLRKRFVHPAAE